MTKRMNEGGGEEVEGREDRWWRRRRRRTRRAGGEGRGGGDGEKGRVKEFVEDEWGRKKYKRRGGIRGGKVNELSELGEGTGRESKYRVSERDREE